MKIRSSHYFIKEGFLNAWRNKLMSLAAIGVMAASLIVFGAFFLVTMNLHHNTQILRDQPEMQIFLKPETDQLQVSQFEQTLTDDTRIAGKTFISRDQAFAKFKDMFTDQPELASGMDASFLPVSWTVKLKDASQSEQVAADYKTNKLVHKVSYSMDVIRTIDRINYWLRAVSIVLLVLLLTVALFIIANTIRLTVFARRKEINIMKYVGATDWFIRWPFMIEGLLIGVVGAIASFIIITAAYTTIVERVNSDLVKNGGIISLVPAGQLAGSLVAMFLVVGAVVGVSGSAWAIHRHLKV